MTLQHNAQWLAHVDEVAKRDDWHTELLGSDIRMLCSLIRRYQADLDAPPATTPEDVEAVAWAIGKAECRIEQDNLSAETPPISDAERHRKLAEAAIAAMSKRFEIRRRQ